MSEALPCYQARPVEPSASQACGRLRRRRARQRAPAGGADDRGAAGAVGSRLGSHLHGRGLGYEGLRGCHADDARFL